MDRNILKYEAIKWHHWFNKGQRNWSIAHHGAMFGSILCSVAAGAALQMKNGDLIGLATVLTSIAAALTSLSASGGFERKWRSNRLSRSRIDSLLIDLEAESPDIQDLANQLKDIIARHDQEIVKFETPAPTKQEAPEAEHP